MSGPITAAYADAIHVECPECGAPVEAFCKNPISHKLRKIPCAARLRLADK